MSLRQTLAVALLCILTPLLAFGAGHAVPKMANILLELQHFPTDAQKATLAAIQNDSSYSDAERQVASAIANIQHKVSDADRERLSAIASDESLHESLRTLAKVLVGINHMLSDADKETLRKLGSGH